MTPQEQTYLNECETLLQVISQHIVGAAGPRAIAINALSEHIRKTKGLFEGPRTATNENKEFIVGLTFADLMQLQNGGTLLVNPKEVGLVDLPITILLGGTDERMASKMADHPDGVTKIVESHGQQKN